MSSIRMRCGSCGVIVVSLLFISLWLHYIISMIQDMIQEDMREDHQGVPKAQVCTGCINNVK